MSSPGGNRVRKPGEDPPLPPEMLSILQSDLRRDVLRCLRGAPNETTTTHELVERLLEEREEEESKHLTIRLHHIELPKLAEANLIEFDPRRGTLRYLPDNNLGDWLTIIRDLETR